MPRPNQMQELIIEDARQYRAANQSREREAMVAEVERWIQEPEFRAGENTSKQQPQATFDDVANKADDGPISPFVTSFKLRDGGIVYRKHWFQWMKTIAMPTLWLIGSFAFVILMLAFAPLQALGAIGWVIAFVAFLIGIVWFYLADWDWRHDYYVITDNNITIVNRRPLWLQDESDQVLLKQVDNVVSETKGIFQQLFRFGDVRVSLVGADYHKLFDNVPYPLDVQGEITRRQLRLKEREQQENQQLQREIVGEYLSLYHQQSQQPNPQVYPDDQPLPYQPNQQGVPQYPQQQQPNTPSSRPSPLGNRPSISSGRPYNQNQQQPSYSTQQPQPYQPQMPSQPSQPTWQNQQPVQPSSPQPYQPSGQSQRPPQSQPYQQPSPPPPYQPSGQPQMPPQPPSYQPNQQSGQNQPPNQQQRYQQGEQKPPPPPPMPPNFNK